MTPEPTAPVVVIGDALIDEVHDGTSIVELVGGAALNVAVGLVRLGVPATLVAMVGDDEAGRHIRAYLRDRRVGLIATPSALGSSRAIARRVDGEPTYTFNEAARSRQIVFGKAVRAAIADAPLVAVSCFPFDDPEQTERLLEVTADARVAVDPNPREGMLADRAAFVAGFERLVARSTLVKVGAADAALLYGAKLQVLRARLAARTDGAVVTTAGAAGGAVQVGRNAVMTPIAEAPGPVVDTIGAGDAVFATMIAAIVRRTPEGLPAWESALERAMAIAAATVRGDGGLLRLPEDAARADRGMGS